MPKKGSEGGKIKKKLNLEFIKDPTPLDLKPTSPQMLRGNPGGAILSNIKFIRLVNYPNIP